LRAIESIATAKPNQPYLSRALYLKANILKQLGNTYEPKRNERYRYYLKTALETCKTAQSRFPNSPYYNLISDLIADINSKNLRVVMPQAVVPMEHSLIQVGYKNVKKIECKSYKVSTHTLAHIHKEYLKFQNAQPNQFLSRIESNTLVSKEIFLLPDTKDHQNHLTEIKLNPLEKGQYIVVIKELDSSSIQKPYVYTYGLLKVSSLRPVILSGTKKNKIMLLEGNGQMSTKAQCLEYIYTVNRENHRVNRNTAKVIEKDEQGFFCPNTSEILYSYDQYFVKSITHTFIAGGDTISSYDPFQTNYYDGYQYGGSTLWEESMPKKKYIFLCDRAIYRPGQTVYFKGIAYTGLHNEYKVMHHEKIKLICRNANYQEIDSQELSTSAMGSFKGSFTLPTQVLTGNFSIEIDQSHHHSIQVEEYKRPRFEVKFEPLKNTPKLLDTLQVQVQAKAFSGQNISQALVKYRVSRIARFPYWCSIWRAYHPSNNLENISTGITKTDENGAVGISFVAIPDISVPESEAPIFDFEISIEITDLNGETIYQNQTISLSYQAVFLSTELHDFDKNNAQEKFEIEILAENAQKQKVDCKGSLKLYKLNMPNKAYRARNWQMADTAYFTKAEFEKYFPHDDWENTQDHLTWAVESVVYESDFNTSLQSKHLLSVLRQAPIGVYKIELSTIDQANKPVRFEKSFRLIDSQQNKLASPKMLEVLNLKPICEPSETAKILIGSTEQEVHVLLTIKTREEEKHEWMVLNNEQKIYTLPIKEKHMGNVAVFVSALVKDRLVQETAIIEVPFSKKELSIKLDAIHDKTKPREKHQWKIKVISKDKTMPQAELCATMFDASLESIVPHDWNFNAYNRYYPYVFLTSLVGLNNYWLQGTNSLLGYAKRRKDGKPIVLPNFIWNQNSFNSDNMMLMDMNSKPVASAMIRGKVTSNNEVQQVSEMALADSKVASPGMPARPSSKQPNPAKEIQPRENLQELAFFYPDIKTDNEGNATIEFTQPDALTRWKIMALAHTNDMKIGVASKEITSQKPLMLSTQMPRYFRAGDSIAIFVKVTNMQTEHTKVNVNMTLKDALSGSTIIHLKEKTLLLKPKQSEAVHWWWLVPSNIVSVEYVVSAQSADFSDAEKAIIPVLQNSIHLTEAMPFIINGNEHKSLTFESFKTKQAKVENNRSFTFELCTSPIWMAIKAIPYLMENPSECAEQCFSRLYSNTLAGNLLEKYPKMKLLLDQWRLMPVNAFESELEKNKELKHLLLEETPWLRDAQTESEQRKNLCLLFDLNQLNYQKRESIEQLISLQNTDGGFPWYKGMYSSEAITAYILAGLGKLLQQNAIDTIYVPQLNNLISKSCAFLDSKLYEHYLQATKLAPLQKGDQNSCVADDGIAHILYARSFFSAKKTDKKHLSAYPYYLASLPQCWQNLTFQGKGMAMVALSRNGKHTQCQTMLQSLLELSTYSPQLGLYWQDNQAWDWYHAKIESHCMLMEAIEMVQAKHPKLIDAAQWLLSQKQTQHWGTSKATVDACYILLGMYGSQNLEPAKVKIKLGKYALDSSEDPNNAATGYIKKTWTTTSIEPSMATITVENNSSTMVWGAAYWQYSIAPNKVQKGINHMNISKSFYKESIAKTGVQYLPLADTSHLTVGDKILVKTFLNLDRDMEYITLKDQRATCLEPIHQLSGYKYTLGLGYYESIRDNATNYFFQYLPKGKYVFEYYLRVSQKGKFSLGNISIQSMYAPQFVNHTEGGTIKID
jgi:uncharacterized protein YfaS (alpha-2-macroglobulin family)